MRILFVAPFVPGTRVDHAGGRDLFYLLKDLASRHEVSLVALDLGDGTGLDLEDLRGVCHHVEIVRLKGGTSALVRYLRHLIWPRAVAMFYSPELATRLEQLLQRATFDVVQYENVQTVPYAARVAIPGVLDCIDLSFLPLFQQHLAGRGSRLRRWYRALEWPRLQVYEARALQSFPGFVARSERDAVLIKSLNADAAVAVKQGAWPLTFELAIDPSRVRPRRRPPVPVVTFVGAMWRNVNSEACEYFLDRIWPLIRRAVPAAEFHIVGASPPPSILGRHGRDNVTVTGYLADLLPQFRECSVMVVPLLAAGGIITKVVDAMLVGIPVVATPVTNQGINAVPGRDILLADDPERFADAVVQLLTDEELYGRISAGGEQFMGQFLDWEGAVRRIESLYREVAAKPHAANSSL